MKFAVRCFYSLLLAVVAQPTFAVYNQQVVLTGGPELASAQITFTPADGQPVTVTTKEEGDDRRVAYIAFGGNTGSGGTLNITANGRTQSYDLPAASNGQIIRVDTTSGAVTVEPAPPPRTAYEPKIGPMTISGFYGMGNMEVSPIGSSALLNTPDGDSFLSESEEDVGIDTYGVEITVPLGETGLRVHGVWASFSGDEDDRADSAPAVGGGVNNAIVFQQLSPTYGSGLNGGTLPIETNGKLDFDGNKYGGSLSWPCGRIPHMSGTLGIYYGTSDIDQEQADTFTTVAVSSLRKASVSQDSWYITLGGTYLYPFNDVVGVSVSAGAIAQFYDADLKSTQAINFFTDPQEVLETKDDDDATAFGGYFAVAVPVTFGPVVITPTAMIETGTVSAAIEYPESGTDVTNGAHVELDNDSTTNWFTGVNFGIRF
jgi:hypothetical protein